MVCDYKDVKKHLELRNKINWYGEYYSKGMRILAAVSDKCLRVKNDIALL
jgi:hypothetical protein